MKSDRLAGLHRERAAEQAALRYVRRRLSQNEPVRLSEVLAWLRAAYPDEASERMARDALHRAVGRRRARLGGQLL